MKLTRKELLVGGAAGAALGAAGIYELVDKLADSPPTHSVAGREPEQHLVDGMRVEKQEGVEVVVPLRHHEVVTARVVAPRDELLDARASLAAVLAKLDADFPATPDGLGLTVAWGLPYFQTYVPDASDVHLPFDRRARKRALFDAIRFPSDPDDTLLEENDVAFLFRSDNEEHIRTAATEIADRMNCSMGTLASQLKRARTLLARKLEHLDVRGTS